MTPRHTDSTDKNLLYSQTHIRLMSGDASTNNRAKLKKGSQKYNAYARMLRGEKLNTRTEALSVLNGSQEQRRTSAGQRLPNRISELKALGVPIDNKIINRTGNIKEYWIKEEYLDLFKKGTSE